ncbi:class I SAM-dependent methyltransferase [Winogradskyella sp. DF17]|uniref:Class I SAM-dependent methyltransferase n=1 Tax=Winogradskyella pelagia TaxID=2819984 RepID=A0ABS3T1R0_9FLAO|nr:class I SAM-dependent methyltransferase [Winogradskyella sp. DF17]MBO3116686.1 class I SAM-dependent methyltransferase [Winogradskyella sp. DF17]
MINKIRQIIGTGRTILKDPYFDEGKLKSSEELGKSPSRTTIINALLELTASKNYLEIGVRNPDANYKKVNCVNKFSVDPGLEFKSNPVDFKLTSDDFFARLDANKLSGIDNSIRFDVVFIDGLHTSYQVDRDIENSLKYIHKTGFIVLHDCNPPTEYHQRENYDFKNSPAGIFWNGTTWKAFYKYRHRQDLYSICFDTDWGVGVISKSNFPLFNNISSIMSNPYFEYDVFNEHRLQHLNLVEFKEWASKL